VRYPDTWPQPDTGHVDEARRNVAAVLADRDLTSTQLREFYDPTRNFAGPVFDDRSRSDLNDLSALDLLAVTTMHVRAGPRALSAFLNDGEARTELLGALRASDDQ
jgi:hypothetical protein